jgi:hypothetical protein
MTYETSPADSNLSGDPTVPLGTESDLTQPETRISGSFFDLPDSNDYPDFSYDQPSLIEPVKPADTVAAAPVVEVPVVRTQPHPAPRPHSEGAGPRQWADQPAPAPYSPAPYSPAPYSPTQQYAQYQPYPTPTGIQPHQYAYSQFSPMNPEHPSATASLVLGIAGLFLAVPGLSPAAWYLGAKGRREIAANPGRWRPGGSITAGYVLGIIGTLLWALGIIWFVLVIVIAIVSSV